MNINTGTHIITNKGNHGIVLDIKDSIALVRIGNTNHSMLLSNLVNIDDGITLRVKYIDDTSEIDTYYNETVFIKHGTSLFNAPINNLQIIVEKLLKQKLTTQFTILEILIP
jgi:hypothetical protein